MKKITILLTAISLQFGNAQNPIVNITNRVSSPPEGIYYKDINNILSPYEGTWMYTDADVTFKIELEKRTMQSYWTYYEDLLVGEYLYVKNGQTLINTLSQLGNVYTDARMHNISGNLVISNQSIPRCPECNPEEKRILLSFIDPVAEYGGRMVARLIEINGTPAIKVNIRMSGKYKIVGEFYEYDAPVCPMGEFVLIRQ